jgi:flagellar basal body rod protein FlgG
MNVSLYQAAAALEGSLHRQDVIAENLSSSSNAAFKRNRVGFHSVNAEMFNDALKQADKTEIRFMFPRITGYIDFQQGTLMPTRDYKNVSLDGPGFFAVNGPHGTVFTRDGSFHITNAGKLVTKEGYPLRNSGGADINVDPDNPKPISIDTEGNLSQGGAPLGKLEIMTFSKEDLQKLKRLNSVYFDANSGTPIPTNSRDTRVVQGFLEGSNTTPTHEMGELMTTLRHFEANQRIMKIHDENMGKMIQQLGNTQ